MEDYSQATKKARISGGMDAVGMDASSRKSRSCTKFYSVSGCMYWSTCNFSHSTPPSSMPINMGPPSVGGGAFNHYGEAPRKDYQAVRKTRLCNKFLSAEGCPFGDKCNFAHGDDEIQQFREPTIKRSYDVMQQGYGYGGRPDMMGASQATATATMTIRADTVGIIIGKGGMHVKHINTTTGARIKIAEPENPKSTTRTIEMSGTLDQIQMAQQMVQQLLVQFQATPSPMPEMNISKPVRGHPGNVKTKLCANFTAGSCKYSDKCHFAHGEEELRQYESAADAAAIM